MKYAFQNPNFKILLIHSLFRIELHHILKILFQNLSDFEIILQTPSLFLKSILIYKLKFIFLFSILSYFKIQTSISKFNLNLKFLNSSLKFKFQFKSNFRVLFNFKISEIHLLGFQNFKFESQVSFSILQILISKIDLGSLRSNFQVSYPDFQNPSSIFKFHLDFSNPISSSI